MQGVNTPWNLSSFWSCLSHLWPHLSPQVPPSFVVWIELFLANSIPCLQLLIPFHPSCPTFYTSSLAVRSVCHQNQSHQVSYYNSLHIYHALYFILSLFELFSALKIIKILLKHHAVFLTFTVFSPTFLITSSLSIFLFPSHTPYFLLYSIQLLLLPCAGCCTTFLSMIYKHAFLFFSFWLFSNLIFYHDLGVLY